MAQSVIGQLLIYLGLNSAGYEGGLSNSLSATRRFTHEVTDQFRSIGTGFGQLISQVTGLGPAFATAMSTVAAALRNVAVAFTVASGAAVAFSVIMGSIGAAAGLAVIGLAAVGLHTANTAARMAQLSDATGVSISALTGFAPLASAMGISTDQFARGLERMDRSLTVAIEQGEKGNSVWKRLGFTLKELGELAKNPEKALEALADRFDRMGPTSEKTAAAIQIFGRAGADLIPFLNLGVATMKEFIDYARKVGAVLDDEDKGKVLAFQIQLAELKLGFQGIEYQLMKGMLPAFQQINKALTGSAEGGEIWVRVGKLIGDSLAVVAIFAMAAKTAVMQAIIILDSAGQYLARIVTGILHVSAAAAYAATGQFAVAKAQLKTAVADLDSVTKDFVDRSKKEWGDLAQFWKDVNGPTPTVKKPKGGPDLDISADASKLQFITQMIAQLQRQADKEEELAKAQGSVSAATIKATAAAEKRLITEKLVDEAIAKGLSLKEFQKGLSLVSQELDVNSEKQKTFTKAVEKISGVLDAATNKLAFFKSVVASTTEMDNFRKKIEETAKVLQDEAEAGTKVERTQAKIGAPIIELTKNYEEQKKALNELMRHTETAPATIEEMVAALGREKVALSQVTEEANKAKEAIPGIQRSIEQNKLDKTLFELQGKFDQIGKSDAFLNVAATVEYLTKVIGLDAAELTKVDENGNTLLGTMRKIRAEQMKLDGAKIAAKFGYSPGEEDTLRIEKSTVAIARHAAWWDKNTAAVLAYDRAIRDMDAKLEDLKLGVPGAMETALGALHNLGFDPNQLETIVGAMSALKDPAIVENLKSLGATEQQIHDALLQQIADWEDWKAVSGNAIDGVKAGVADLAADIVTVGQMMRDVTNAAFKGIEDNFAKMIVTGKSNWKEFLDSLQEQMLKSELHMAMQKIAAKIADKFNLPGLKELTGVKNDGSDANPFAVKIVSSLPVGSTDVGDIGKVEQASGADGNKSLIEKILGVFAPGKTTAPTGTLGNPLHVIIDNSAFASAVESSTAPISQDQLSSLPLNMAPMSGITALQNGNTTAGGTQIAGSTLSTVGGAVPGVAGAIMSIAGQVASVVGKVLATSQGVHHTVTQGALHTIVDNSVHTAIDTSPLHVAVDNGPLHVLVDNQQGGGGSDGGAGGIVSGILGGAGGGISSGFMDALSALPLSGAGVGGDGGGFSDVFAGAGDVAMPAAAGGGDFPANKPILVGEKRPEVFQPKSAGRIFPSIDAFLKETFGSNRREWGGDVTPGLSYLAGERRPEVFMPESMRSVNHDSHDTYGGHITNFNFNGEHNYDSFRRSEGQLAAMQATQAQAGKQRNG